MKILFILITLSLMVLVYILAFHDPDTRDHGWTHRHTAFLALIAMLATGAVVGIAAPDMTFIFILLTFGLLALAYWLIFRIAPSGQWPGETPRRALFLIIAATLLGGAGIGLLAPAVIVIFIALSAGLGLVVIWLLARSATRNRRVSKSSRKLARAAIILAAGTAIALSFSTLDQVTGPPTPGESRDQSGEEIPAAGPELLARVLRQALQEPRVTDAAWSDPGAAVLMVGVWDNGRDRSDMARSLCSLLTDAGIRGGQVLVMEQRSGEPVSRDGRELGRAQCD